MKEKYEGEIGKERKYRSLKGRGGRTLPVPGQHISVRELEGNVRKSIVGGKSLRKD